jgi:hypothetical protein
MNRLPRLATLPLSWLRPFPTLASPRRTRNSLPPLRGMECGPRSKPPAAGRNPMSRRAFWRIWQALDLDTGNTRGVDGGTEALG